MQLVNRQLPPEAAGPDEKLFAPEGSAEGCASGECLPELAPADEPEPTAPVGRTADDQWRDAVDQVRQVSPRHGKSLSYGRFLGFTPTGEARIAFPQEATFHRASVLGTNRPIIEEALSTALRRPVKLLEEVNAALRDAAPRSIAEVEATDRASRERGIDQKVREHPAIRSVLKHLGGSIEHIAYLEAPKAAPTAAPAGDEPEPDAGG